MRIPALRRRFALPMSSALLSPYEVYGSGIVLCPDSVLARDIAVGRLVPLLESSGKQTHSYNAIYLEGSILPRKVRVLIDFALEDVQASDLF